MIKININIVLLLIVFSCKSSKEKGGGQIPIVDIESNISSLETVNISDIAKSIEYVLLETNTNSLIQYIRDIIPIGGTFLIVEAFSCKAFNKRGEYICSYGSRGEGPGQFPFIRRVSIDEKNNKVYINGYSQLFEYSLDGNFLHEITIPQEIFNNSPYGFPVIALGDYNFCALVNSAKPYRFFVFNDNNHQVTGESANYNNDTLLTRNMMMYWRVNTKELRIGKRIIYKEGLNDTVFCLNSNNELQPIYLFKFGKYRNPVELLKNVKEEGYDREMEKHLHVDNFIESSTFLFFDCWFYDYMPLSERREVKIPDLPAGFEVIGGPDNIVKSLFNRKSGELVFLKKNNDLMGFKNDIDGGMPFWPIASYDGDQLVMAVEAFELKEYVAGDEFKNSKPKYPEKKKALKELVDNLHDDDNPVLMVVIIK